MVENGLSESVIGVAFDGSGYGLDGAVWGGEFLISDYRNFKRAAHLRYVGMPGGDQAVREPWRMALAYLVDSGASDALLKSRVPKVALGAAQTMLERRFNTPVTSSVGRLFDAVAALAGVRDRVSFEGQARHGIGMACPGSRTGARHTLLGWMNRHALMETNPALIIDTRPLIRSVAEDVRRGAGANPSWRDDSRPLWSR